MTMDLEILKDPAKVAEILARVGRSLQANRVPRGISKAEIGMCIEALIKEVKRTKERASEQGARAASAERLAPQEIEAILIEIGNVISSRLSSCRKLRLDG